MIWFTGHWHWIWICFGPPMAVLFVLAWIGWCIDMDKATEPARLRREIETIRLRRELEELRRER